LPGSAAIRNILFIRIDRIGDMVLSTPAIRALRQLFPTARLAVLASPSNHVLLRHDPAVDDIVVFDTRSMEDTRRSIRRIRSPRGAKFDLVVDPTPGHDLKTSLVALAAGAPLRVGYPGDGREVFYNRLVPAPPKDRHFVDVALDVVRALGLADPSLAPSIVMAKEEIGFAREWLQCINPQNRAVIGVHPGAYYPSQRWPIKNFITLASDLQKKGVWLVVLLGGASEQDLLREIASALHHPTPVFQSGDLRQTAAVMTQLQVMVCNNSGPLHLAAALGVPTVSFMGPTNAARWWPVGSSHCVLRINDLACLGCEAGICPKGSQECLQRITPDLALDAVERILENSGP
jgi:heptosyltransferase-2